MWFWKSYFWYLSFLIHRPELAVLTTKQGCCKTNWANAWKYLTWLSKFSINILSSWSKYYLINHYTILSCSTHHLRLHFWLTHVAFMIQYISYFSSLVISSLKMLLENFVSMRADSSLIIIYGTKCWFLQFLEVFKYGLKGFLLSMQ